MAITAVDIVPRSLPGYGEVAPPDQDRAYATGAKQVQDAILQPGMLRAARDTMADQSSAARAAMELRPLETELRKKKIAAEVSDVEATAARETYVKKSALDLQALLLDLKKGIFPNTARQATAESITGANQAGIDATLSGVKLGKVSDIADAVAGEITNMKAKVAIEGSELLRLKDDPTRLKDSLGKKLVEIGVPYDPNESAESLFAKWQQGRNEELQTLTTLEKIKHANTGDSTKAEAEMRKEFVGSPIKQRYDVVSEATAKIRSTAGKPPEQTTATDDLATIFSYMKILDPGSTVREGEFATAQNAAGVPDQILNMYNKIRTGERLNPGQRLSFLNTATDLFKSQQSSFDKHKGFYTRIAERTGLNVDNVVGDAQDGQATTPPESISPTAPAAPSNATGPRKRVTLRNGKVVFGWYVKDPQTGVTKFEVDQSK